MNRRSTVNARELSRKGVMELDRPAPETFSEEVARVKFKTDIPFTKGATGDKGNVEVRGYASTWVEDRDGEFIDPAAFDKTIDSYLKNPIILWQHDAKHPIGTMKELSVDQYGLVVAGDIPKPDKSEDPVIHTAYNKIASGIVKTFSIGGFFEREFVMGRAVIKTVDLLEISVVSIPSNPDSIFEAAAKALKGGVRRPTLLQGHVTQMRQLLGVDELTDPELVVMTPAERVARYEFIAEVYRKSGSQPPEIDEYERLRPELASIGTDEQSPDLTPRVIALVKKIHGGVEQKGGRILSRRNEAKLRDVRVALDGMEGRIDSVADDAKKAIAETRSELDVVLKQVDEDETGDGAAEAGSENEDGGGDVAETAEGSADDTEGADAGEGKGHHEFTGEGDACEGCGEPSDHPNHNEDAGEE